MQQIELDSRNRGQNPGRTGAIAPQRRLSHGERPARNPLVDAGRVRGDSFKIIALRPSPCPSPHGRGNAVATVPPGLLPLLAFHRRLGYGGRLLLNGLSIGWRGSTARALHNSANTHAAGRADRDEAAAAAVLLENFGKRCNDTAAS